MKKQEALWRAQESREVMKQRKKDELVEIDAEIFIKDWRLSIDKKVGFKDR